MATSVSAFLCVDSRLKGCVFESRLESYICTYDLQTIVFSIKKNIQVGIYRTKLPHLPHYFGCGKIALIAMHFIFFYLLAVLILWKYQDKSNQDSMHPHTLRYLSLIKIDQVVKRTIPLHFIIPISVRYKQTKQFNLNHIPQLN